MAALTGVWYACARSVTPSNQTHQDLLMETGGNRVIVSQEVAWGVDNSELEVANWAAGGASRPRMIPGQTRSDITYAHTMLMYAHTMTGYETQHATQSYNHLQPEISGIEGFLVYHEHGDQFTGLTPVMGELTTRFNADRGHNPELWAVEDRNKDIVWNSFYDPLWGYSNNTIFMSERYNWKSTGTYIQQIERFEIGDERVDPPLPAIGGIITTAEDARNQRNDHAPGRACRWTALVAAHTDNSNNYYTPSLAQLRFASLLPIGLGAEGVIYYAFDVPTIQDDIYRNATTRQNIAALKPRMDWLKDRLRYYPYTYVGYKYSTYQDQGGTWHWTSFTEDESHWLDRIQENGGDVPNQLKRLTIGNWHWVQGREALAITSRDPWTGNYSYTAYLKGSPEVYWDGVYQGRMSQFTFTMLKGDTKLLEMKPWEP